MICGAQLTTQSPEDLWQQLETEITETKKHEQDFMHASLDIENKYKIISHELTRYFEIFARALSRLFTIGDICDDANTYMHYVKEFLF